MFKKRVLLRKNKDKMSRMLMRLIRPNSAILHANCPTSLLLSQVRCWGWRAITLTLSLRSTERLPVLCKMKIRTASVMSGKPSLIRSTRTQPVSGQAWTSTILVKAMKTWLLQLVTISACLEVFQRAQLTPSSTHHRTEHNNVALTY